MTAIKKFITALCVFAIAACSDSDDDLPNIPVKKLSELKLVDFNFSSNVDYMEMRYLFSGDEPENFLISYEFDTEIKGALTETQLSNLKQSTALSGIGSGCLPSFCTFYFVTLDQEVALVIDNALDLQILVGDIDVPAELHLVLFTRKYFPLYYEKISDGFRVVAGLSGCNGEAGEDLLEVDSTGNVVFIREVDRRAVSAVC